MASEQEVVLGSTRQVTISRVCVSGDQFIYKHHSRADLTTHMTTVYKVGWQCTEHTHTQDTDNSHPRHAEWHT